MDDQDHHYIPQFLLRNWCDKITRKLTVYARRNGRIVTSLLGTKGTGYGTNLYAYEDAPGGERYVIEQRFMTPDIDTPAALIVKKC